LDIYIIFDGEASVLSKSAKVAATLNDENIQNKTLVDEIILNRFGPRTLLGDDQLQVLLSYN